MFVTDLLLLHCSILWFLEVFMGSYIDANLTSNERVIKEAEASWESQWPFFLPGVFFIATGYSEADGISFTIFLGGLLICIAVLRVLTTELALTNKRVIAKVGLIRRDTVELRLEKIESLMVNQSIFGRMLNYGSVSVTGTGGTKTPIPYISNPASFRMAVNEFLENPSQFD